VSTTADLIICARKKKKIPSRTEQQKTVARAKCGNLYLKNQGFPNPEKLKMVITPLFLNIMKKKSIGFKANFI
jgi:hypothetical protein